MLELAASLLPPLAGGAVLGFLLRKGVKLLAGVAGLFLASLAFLEGAGYVKVDWARLSEDVSRYMRALAERLASLDAAGFAREGAPLAGLAAGALLGWWLAGKA